MRFFILTGFLTICFSVFGQVDSFQKIIIDCLYLNGTPAKYSKVYNQTLEILINRFETANVPEDFWKELKTDKEEKINELIPFLAFAYRKYFTENDIVLMTAFYKTEVAQTMLVNHKTLTEAQNEEIKVFLESDIGLKIEAKQAELSTDITDIIANWKRDLFSEKMGTLVKSGYSPQ